MDTAGSTLAHSGDRWRLNARQASVDTGKRAAAPASDCPQAQRQTSEADQHRAATAGRLGQPHQSLAECAFDGQTRDGVAMASTVVQAGLAAQVSQAGGPTKTVRRGVIALIKQMARDNRLWGAERIRGEQLKLDLHICKRTIQKYIRQLRGRRP